MSQQSVTLRAPFGAGCMGAGKRREDRAGEDARASLVALQLIAARRLPKAASHAFFTGTGWFSRAAFCVAIASAAIAVVSWNPGDTGSASDEAPSGQVAAQGGPARRAFESSGAHAWHGHTFHLDPQCADKTIQRSTTGTVPGTAVIYFTPGLDRGVVNRLQSVGYQIVTTSLLTRGPSAGTCLVKAYYRDGSGHVWLQAS